MANERPQLSLVELHQLRWALGALLTMVALGSVWYLDVEASLLLLFAFLTAAVVLVRPAVVSRVPGWLHKLAFPVALSVFAFDLYTFKQLLPALVRLAILLLWYRVAAYRRRRDDLQLVLLGLFLIVTAGVLTVSIGFAVQIIVFVALGLGLLFIRTLLDSAGSASAIEMGSPGVPPPWAKVEWRHLLMRVRAVMDWKVWVFSVVLFGGLVGLSAMLFLSIPRFQLESSLFLDKWMNRRSVSGFTETLRFGEVSDIQKSESIAFSVEVGDAAEMPDEPYWRMIVLDEYHEHVFRLSAALKRAQFGPERTRSRIEGIGSRAGLGDARWTFYIEPGVSRYLPLLGGLRGLRFTEPQAFTVSESLNLVVLSRVPATFKAYRVDRMSREEWIQDSAFETASQSETRASVTYRDLPFVDAEKQAWEDAARAITGGVSLDAREFSRRAILWLQGKHTYSLSNTLPPGKGDPLLRWALSGEPGHCELFAGSFTMLARAAGFPTRIVGGFVGGSWNGTHLNVRNSNAHAWCEIFDGNGRWLRIDPTAPVTDREISRTQREERLRSRLPTEQGWSARLDRLRMFWYRRIVQFEQQDQANLVRTLKEKTASSSEQLRGWLARVAASIKTWFSGPWDLQHGLRIAAVLAGVTGLFFAWRSVRRLSGWRSGGGKGLDPIRRQAGQWLRRFDASGRIPREGESVQAVEQQLQRLRYGPRESWPEPKTVFQQARRIHRGTTKRSGRRP